MQIIADLRATVRGRMQLLTIGACLLAALAYASSAQAAVNGSHVIATLFSTSALELSGYTPGATLDVTVTRQGTAIGHASGTVADDGTMNVNGGAQPCWIDTTPAMLPGDVVSVSGDGPTDSMVIQDISAGRPAKGSVANTIIVHGTARDAAGNQLQAGATESRLITTGKFANGKKSIRATAVYDSATSTNWTATFTNVTGGDVSTALNSTSRGVYSALVSEVTISENPGAPGPSAPCTAPLAANGVTSTDHVYKGAPTVNAANVSTDLGLSGIVQANATAVSVKVSGAGVSSTTPVPATLSGGTWSATVPAADVAALADGTLTASATYTTPNGTLSGATLSIVKDTVAPAAPDASPAGGTYTSAQSVSLFDTDTGASMFYTTNGSDPGTTAGITTKAFSTPISVASSQTIKALAVDTAGNPSSISANAYDLVAKVSLTPGSIDYGSQTVDTPSTGLTVTLKNTGAATMTVSGVAFTGADAGDFLRGISTCGGATLAPGDSCTIDNVRFQPTSNGAKAASLTFTDDAPGGTHDVALTGTGVGGAPPPPPPATPVASITPTSIDFGSQQIGTTSASQTVNVKNTGDAALHITTTPLSGADFNRGTDTCTNSTVDPQATCSIDVTFSPATTGSKSGSLTINDDAAGNPHTIPLAGTGTPPPPPPAPAATVTPASLAFGSQTVGGSSADQTVSVKNTGNAPLDIGTTPITGAFAHGAADTCTGKSIAPAATCTIDVRFSPTATGAASGTLTINDNVPGTVSSVSLTGNGTAPTAPAVTLTPASLAFGSVLVGSTSAGQTATITNTGNAPMTMSFALAGTFAGDYAISSSTCGTTLASGSACSVVVAFKPTATGSRPAVLRFTDNANNVLGSTQDVALGGAGTQPAISATPNPVAFGNSTVPALLRAGTSVTKTVSVTNTGSAPLSITTTAIGAAASSSFPGDYTITANTCQNTTRAVGSAACSITIKFAAKAKGTRNAVLTINSNAPTGALKVNLSGTGV